MNYKNSQGLPYWVQLNGMGDGDPTPTPADMPLVEGTNPAWNDVLQHVPEDKRQEVVPKLQEWDRNFQQVNDSLAPWKEFISSGVNPETAQLSLNVLTTIENNPKAAYDAIGKSLGITAQEAKEVVEDLQEEATTTSGITQEQYDQLQRKTDAMAQILLANKRQEEVSVEEQALDQELTALKKEKGDFPESEIVMRMLHKDMSATEAYDDYAKFEESLFKGRRQPPRVLSGGGMIPQPKVDVLKMDRKGTKAHVAEMITQAIQQNQ